MIRKSIEKFTMLCQGFPELECTAPCSMYSFLLQFCCKPREYRFQKPHWTVSAAVDGNSGELVITADSYQRNVELFFTDPAIKCDQQFFDVDSNEGVTVTLDNIPFGISASDIEKQMSIFSCSNIVS